MSGGPLTPLTALVTDTDLTLSFWNTYVVQNLNYFIQSGGSIASAASLVTTNEYHLVTGTTTITNINPATPVAGQPLLLQFQSALTIQNNGGGTGNVRTRTGADRAVKPNEIVAFVYDGTYWREQAPVSNLIAYGKNTGSVSTSGTTFAAGADLLTTALSFVADGSSDYLLTVAAPTWQTSTTTGFGVLHANLDGADAGELTQHIFQNNGNGEDLFVRGVIPAPSAGSHTINARVRDAGAAATITVNGGAGGVGNLLPILVTLERA